MRHQPNPRIDITGQKFGEIEVLRLSDKKDRQGSRLWECKCSCEKILYLHGGDLLNCIYTSCGCKKNENLQSGAARHIASDSVNGTRKSALKAKLHKANKSGHKGVIWMEYRQKWRAYIGFQGKSITLGYFQTKEQAISARIVAEEKYHDPLLVDQKKDIYSQSDLAKALGITRGAIADRLRRGTLPPFDDGKTWRYETISHLLDQSKEQ